MRICEGLLIAANGRNALIQVPPARIVRIPVSQSMAGDLRRMMLRAESCPRVTIDVYESPDTVPPAPSEIPDGE